MVVKHIFSFVPVGHGTPMFCAYERWEGANDHFLFNCRYFMGLLGENICAGTKDNAIAYSALLLFSRDFFLLNIFWFSWTFTMTQSVRKKQN